MWRISIGLLINTVPVRVTLRPADSLVALLTRLQDQQAVLTGCRPLDLGEIQKIAGLGELFDTITVSRTTAPTCQERRRRAGPPSRSSARKRHPITRSASGPRPGIACASPTFRPELLDARDVEHILHLVVGVLSAMAEDPLRPLGGLDLLGGRERDRVLVEWNDTGCRGAGRLGGACSPSRCGGRRARSAVACGGTELSYAELDAAANRLAHRLIELGVRAEQPVGVLMRRSVGLIVGGSWRSSKPAGRTCRSISGLPAHGCGECWPRPAPRWC